MFLAIMKMTGVLFLLVVLVGLMNAVHMDQTAEGGYAILAFVIGGLLNGAILMDWDRRDSERRKQQ